MSILRIKNQIFFGVAFTKESLEVLSMGADDRTRDQFDWKLLETIFLLESCEEAIEVFEDMYICPFCHAVESDGIMIHKTKDEAKQ